MFDNRQIQSQARCTQVFFLGFEDFWGSSPGPVFDKQASLAPCLHSKVQKNTALNPLSHFPIQDRIYWTDLEDEAIYSVNRLTGHDVAKVAEHLNNPLDLVVFHEQRQPKGKTYTDGMNIFCLVLFLGRRCKRQNSYSILKS